MSYKNGAELLPPSLLKEIQKYIAGELVYVPKPNKKRAAWGELSGSRREIQNRNKEIYSLYMNGKTVSELALDYCLSEDSIKKIVQKQRKLA
ncbi:helix-turn-helix domain of resolvase protein [Haloplasma contractile SSD-17B]|uniref:Helix-turn-helix domain of resolvase protein n=2 Tax=Haloplasma TaxID=471824 RepID=F7PU70_9MOLU|nr:CD3324 family protein [Haloplasma contractile]ERJ11751.1 helix-turn-helix domain of resolvase protein [Haloplasma contractile SSD-17B]